MGANVGIGTTNPTTPIHIFQNNSTTDTTNGLLVEQDGTGDAVVQFLLSGTKRWMMGIDNSDSDKFKIVHGVSDLGSNNVLHLDTSNNLTLFGNVSSSETSTGSFGQGHFADKLGIALNESVLNESSSMALSVYSPENLASLLEDKVEMTREEKIAYFKAQQQSVN